MPRVSVPLAKIPKTEAVIEGREEAKIVNGYVYNDGIQPSVTKRPGREIDVTMPSEEILYHPFIDADSNVWWITDGKRAWKNDSVAHISDTEWQNLATFSNDTTVGTIAWSDPGDAATRNDLFPDAAKAKLASGEVSNYLKGLDLSGVDVPTGATIKGVAVRFDRKEREPYQTGLQEFSSFRSAAATGLPAWQNPGNAESDDDSYTTTESVTNEDTRSEPLFSHNAASSLSSLIPEDAEIVGIQVRVVHKASENSTASSGVLWDSVTLTKDSGGTPFSVGNDLSHQGLSWLTVESASVFGGSSDLWGTTWTRDEILSSGFGVRIVVDLLAGASPLVASIDSVRVLISYKTQGRIVDSSVRLVKGGVISGNNNAKTAVWDEVKAGGPLTGEYIVYGGSEDLWGLTLTETDVEAATFGVVISVTTQEGSGTAEIYHVQMKIFYEDVAEVSLTNLYINNGISWAEDEQFIYIHGGGDGTAGSSDYFIQKSLGFSEAINEITDTNHPLKKATPDRSPPGVVALDGFAFIIGNHEATSDTDFSFSRIYNSNLGDFGVWGATDFIASNKPGFLKSLALHHRHIVAFGENSIEFFYNAGHQVGSPLTNRLDLSYDIGLIPSFLYGTDDNVHSRIVRYGDRLFFIGRPHKGSAGIYVLDNFKVIQISTPAVERLLKDDGSSVIRGVLSFNNKDFLIVNHDPFASFSLVLDLEENIWYEWTVNYDRGVVGKKLAISGSSSLFNAKTLKDDGTNYEISIITPRINDIDGNSRGLRKFCNFIIIDSDSPGVKTEVGVSFSDDDYQTFSSSRIIDINNKRKRAFRWGHFFERAYKISYTGDNNFKLYTLDMDISLEEGN